MLSARSFSRPPLISTLLIAFCCVIYVATLSGAKSNGYVLCPQAVFRASRYDQLFSAPFLHGSVLHLLFNMLSLNQIGRDVETQMGSLPFLGLVLFFVPTTSLLYTLLELGLSSLLPSVFSIHCVLGFSGVIFALIMVQQALMQRRLGSQSGTTRIWGIEIPIWLYPWVMLVLISVIMPKVSFMGHLSGILIGILYSKGLFQWFSLKSSRVIAFENLPYIQWLTGSSWYCRCPDESPLPSFQLSWPVSISSETSSRFRRVLSCCGLWPAIANFCRKPRRPTSYHQLRVREESSLSLDDAQPDNADDLELSPVGTMKKQGRNNPHVPSPRPLSTISILPARHRAPGGPLLSASPHQPPASGSPANTHDDDIDALNSHLLDTLGDGHEGDSDGEASDVSIDELEKQLQQAEQEMGSATKPSD